MEETSRTVLLLSVELAHKVGPTVKRLWTRILRRGSRIPPISESEAGPRAASRWPAHESLPRTLRNWINYRGDKVCLSNANPDYRLLRTRSLHLPPRPPAAPQYQSLMKPRLERRSPIIEFLHHETISQFWQNNLRGINGAPIYDRSIAREKRYSVFHYAA